MFGSSNQLECCAGCLRGAATSPRLGSRDERYFATPRSHVLVIEFRNEIFTRLKSLIEDQGCEVSRARTGVDVAAQAERVAPDLMIVNEHMPDESGWLITCKLRLTHVRYPVWLYTARSPEVLADWKEYYCGVDEVIAYGGDFARVASQIRQSLHDRLLGHSGLYHGPPNAARTGTKPNAA